MPSRRSSSRSSAAPNSPLRPPCWRAHPKNSAQASVSLVFAEPEQGAPASKAVLSTHHLAETLSIYSSDNVSTLSKGITPRPSISSLRSHRSEVQEVVEPEEEPTMTQSTPESQPDVDVTVVAVEEPSHAADLNPFTPPTPSPTRHSWFGTFRRVKSPPLKMSMIHMAENPQPFTRHNDSTTSLPVKLIHDTQLQTPPSSPPKSLAAPQSQEAATSPDSMPEVVADSAPSTSPSLPTKLKDETQEYLPSSIVEAPIVDLTLTLPPPTSYITTADTMATGAELSTLSASPSRFPLRVPFFGRTTSKTPSDDGSKKVEGLPPVLTNSETQGAGTDMPLPQPITIGPQSKFAAAAQDSLQNAITHSCDDASVPAPVIAAIAAEDAKNVNDTEKDKVSPSTESESADKAQAPSVEAVEAVESTPSSEQQPQQPPPSPNATGWWSYLAWSPSASNTAPAPSSSNVDPASNVPNPENPSDGFNSFLREHTSDPPSSSSQSQPQAQLEGPSRENYNNDSSTTSDSRLSLNPSPSVSASPVASGSGPGRQDISPTKTQTSASGSAPSSDLKHALGSLDDRVSSRETIAKPKPSGTNDSEVSQLSTKTTECTHASEVSQDKGKPNRFTEEVGGPHQLGGSSAEQHSQPVVGAGDSDTHTTTATQTSQMSWFTPWSWYSSPNAQPQSQPQYTNDGDGGDVGPPSSAHVGGGGGGGGTIGNGDSGNKVEGGDKVTAETRAIEAASGKKNVCGDDPAGRLDNGNRELQAAVERRKEDAEAESGEQSTQKRSGSIFDLENQVEPGRGGSCPGHANTTDTNPIEQSITEYRSGWATFFSSRRLIVKTLGYRSDDGDGNRDEVKRDDNGMEVMEIDFEDDEADGKDQKREEKGKGKEMEMESGSGTEVVKSGKGVKLSIASSSSAPVGNSLKSSTHDPHQSSSSPTKPPLTTSEAAKQETVQSEHTTSISSDAKTQKEKAQHSSSQSQSQSQSASASGSTTPTRNAIPIPLTPSGKTTPDPSSTTNTATTSDRNKRTASPSPSVSSSKSKSKNGKSPPPPNLVLPTWEDTFCTPPRILTPGAVSSGSDEGSGRSAGSGSGGGKLLGRAIGFVSGVLFSTPPTPSSNPGKQDFGGAEDHQNVVGANVAADGSGDKNINSVIARERKERFRHFGKELPRAWDASKSSSPPMSASSSLVTRESKPKDTYAHAAKSSPSSIRQAASAPWRFVAMEKDKVKDAFLGTSHAPHEQEQMRDVLRGCKRVVVIGIHGAVVRTVLGEPTGTSSKFVSMMVQALENFQAEHEVSLEKITAIPLEGEGTIDHRVDKLYTNLTTNEEWIHDLGAADAIFVATHSQGSVVSTHLLNRLIHDRHIRTAKNTPVVCPGPSATGVSVTSAPKPQRVCCLALCGIHLGPLRYLSGSTFVQPYLQYFESSAARELFEFQNTESAVSRSYVNALRHVLNNGVKMVYVASLNDQVVPIYSGLFTAISHPLILRALYIDGDAYHSSDFLSNLLVLLLRILNSGISDSGLLAHLSEATAGSLNGVGHSTAYEELATYSLAVKYLFLTNDGFADHPKAALESFNANNEQNDYEIPWALRDVIADERVLHFFAREFAELRDAFRDWHPKTTILRDLKRKLQPIQRLPSTFYSGNSTSKL